MLLAYEVCGWIKWKLASGGHAMKHASGVDLEHPSAVLIASCDPNPDPLPTDGSNSLNHLYEAIRVTFFGHFL